MADEQHTTESDSLSIAQRDALITRLQTAWSNLPPDKQAALKPGLDEAHGELANLARHGTPPAHHTQQTLRMKSYLTNDWDQHLDTLKQPMNQARAQPLAAPAEVAPSATSALCVSAGGEIVGFGKYQQLDLRWELVAGTVWLENLLHKHPFPPGAPSILQMPDEVSFVLVSDWGTGNFGAGDSPSTKIAKFVPSLKPDYTVHLGDVYYAGTGGEEMNNFVHLWPQGSKGSFALNSNHEMYTGGGPYFNQAVGGSVFNKLQSPWSFFALENSHWIVVGLDSAYFADVIKLYMNGTLGKDNAQIAFLKTVASRGKKVIVLTHHNGLVENGLTGDAPLQLFTDVMNAFAGQPSAAPAYWYWGHVHTGTAYTPLAEHGGLRCRCLGYGALPSGFSTDLKSGYDQGKIEWFESRNANDPGDPLRIFNGFVGLKLSGASMEETFYDENEHVAWRPGMPFTPATPRWDSVPTALDRRARP